jgi:hypothetical protein
MKKCIGWKKSGLSEGKESFSLEMRGTYRYKDRQGGGPVILRLTIRGEAEKRGPEAVESLKMVIIVHGDRGRRRLKPASRAQRVQICKLSRGEG